MTTKFLRPISVYLVVSALMWTLTVPARIYPQEVDLPVKGESVKLNRTLPDPSGTARMIGQQSIEFEKNQGQFDPAVRFRTRNSGSTLFLTATEAVYVLPMAEHRVKAPKNPDPDDPGTIDSFRATEERKPSKKFALRMQIVGANPASTFSGEEETEHKTNYFIGADASKWRTEISNYRRIRYENVYEGIGMVWHGREGGKTQYDFVLEPNAQPEQISLRFEGADRLETDEEGNLVIHTEAGILKQSRPVSYQDTDGQRAEIESGFIVEDNTVRFALGEYDRSKPLTIDPTVNLSNLGFSTFLGAEGGDSVEDLAVDRKGHSYVAGTTSSASFPTVSGSFDTALAGNSDLFVTKLDVFGSNLIYSTYIGGSGSFDGAPSIAVDSEGNAYITSYHFGGDFPVTAQAFDPSYNGSADVVIAKLNATGTSLVYSTYLGGSYEEYPRGIAVNEIGEVYVTGEGGRGEIGFPTTSGAFARKYAGYFDVFLTVLNASGSALRYSTLIGGSESDFGSGIVVDSEGSAYITGLSSDGQKDFPTTASAFDRTHNGSYDVFFCKIDPDAIGQASLLYSTFAGGSAADHSSDIAVDPAGRAYITGSTDDTTADYPTTVGAFDRSPIGTEVFVSKFDPALSGPGSLVYSTFIGGSNSERGAAIAVDSIGNSFITGFALRSGSGYLTSVFPITAGAFDTSYNGFTDAFVTKLNSGGSGLLYSTYLGGGSDEEGVAIDTFGNAFIAGYSHAYANATFFPSTTSAFQTQQQIGGSDAFITKLGDLSIAGRIVGVDGKPVSDAIVTLSGPVSGNFVTDGDGYFYFGDTLIGGTFFVSATKQGFTFNPPSFTIQNLASNQDLIFVGQPSN